MQRYGRDYSNQQFWARGGGYGYGERDYGGRNFGPRSYGGDYRSHPGRGYYGGHSHYWGSGLGGGYDRNYGAGGYDRGYGGWGGGYSGQRMGQRGRQGGFGYYGQGIDDGLENLYSGTYRNHGPIGQSSEEGGMIYPPENRSQGNHRDHPMGGRFRSRYDRGW